MTDAHKSQDELIGYNVLDAFKRACTKHGLRTAAKLEDAGVSEIEWSRGESCYLLDHGDHITGHVHEGLGTKNLVTDDAIVISSAHDGLRISPSPGYYGAGIDGVAMIVNDMITVGVPPVTVGMHLSVGDSRWFDDKYRWRALIEGWSEGVFQSGAVWGHGETPTLQRIVYSTVCELSGSSYGKLNNREMLVNPANIKAGDVIIGLESSGIHANGLTKARQIAEEKGYFTAVDEHGLQEYYRALIQPTVIYVKYLRACQAAGLRWSYGINVTGHGWRKLMRAEQEFTYNVDYVPKPQPIFSFMQQAHGISTEEMYATFNMGIGFMVIVRAADEENAMIIAKKSGYKPYRLGDVCEGPKRVIIKPLGLEYAGETLQVR